VIRLSVEDLATVDAGAVDAFYALGAFAPKPATFDRKAAEAVANAPAAILALLAARNLIDAGADSVLAMHQVVHDFASANTNREVVGQHRQYYLALVDSDRQDWQAITIFYSQIKHAWTALPPDDIDGALSFVWKLSQFQGNQGLFLDKSAWAEHALLLTQSQDRPGDTASMMINLGYSWNALGEKEQALAYLQSSPATISPGR
jgi:hypothetical protein